VSVVRETLTAQSLSPTGRGAHRFTATEERDRQILADSAAAKALFIVTEDVDDFGEADLIATGIATVHHDLFLAERTTTAGYSRALDRMAAGMTNPPRTSDELHARLGRQHPLLIARHADTFATAPDAATHPPPAVQYRGNRCLHCFKVGESVSPTGVCIRCTNSATPL
jgi:hypothetical protein